MGKKLHQKKNLFERIRSLMLNKCERNYARKSKCETIFCRTIHEECEVFFLGAFNVGIPVTFIFRTFDSVCLLLSMPCTFKPLYEHWAECKEGERQEKNNNNNTLAKRDNTSVFSFIRSFFLSIFELCIHLSVLRGIWM